VTDEIYKEIRLIDAERLDPAAAETPARQLRNVLAA